MMVDDIADYLATAMTRTVGTNITQDIMPETPDDCIALTAAGGESPDLVASIEFPTLQVIVRAATRATAKANANTVYTTLHGASELTLNSRRYLFIKANHAPECLGRDKNNRISYVINFKVIKARE